MRSTILQALDVRRLELQIPVPVRKPLENGFVFRYQERSIEQAFVQKLARQTGRPADRHRLHATDAVILRGLSQEQIVIKRTLDEIGKGTYSLALGISDDDLSALLQRYLDNSWQEEFDHPDPFKEVS